jgi:hypothetical protein
MSQDEDVRRGWRAMISLGKGGIKTVLTREQIDALFSILEEDVVVTHIASKNSDKNSLCGNSRFWSPLLVLAKEGDPLPTENHRWCKSCKKSVKARDKKNARFKTGDETKAKEEDKKRKRCPMFGLYGHRVSECGCG